MRQILTSVICGIILLATASFKPTNSKEFKKLSGEWKLIEIKTVTFHPNQQYSITTTKIPNGNTKIYSENGLHFETFNTNNKPILKGRWNLAEGKLIETVEKDDKKTLDGFINVMHYTLHKNKLSIEYSIGKKNVLIVETWEKLK